MRLVVIASSYYPEINGGSTNLHRRLELMSSWGHDVLLLIPDYTKSEFYTAADCRPYLGQVFPRVQVVAFAAHQFFFSKGMSPGVFSLSHMRGVIAEFRPDIIQIESPERLFYGALEIPGLAAARSLGIPIIGVHHTNYVRTLVHWRHEPGFKQVYGTPGVLAMLRGMMRMSYTSYDAALTDTEVAAESLREYGIANVQKAGFLGLNLELFRAAKDEAEREADYAAVQALYPKVAQFGPSRVRLISVGRIAPDKHYHILLAALDLVEQRRPGRVSLLVAGGGFPSIERELQNREGPRVAWLGFVPNETLPPLYRACHACVTASPDETAGLVVMEAMACGLPAIGPASGGVGEFINDGVTGLSFPRDSSERLADAIIRFADDAALRVRLAAAATEAARTFSVEAGTRRMEAIAQRLVNEHKQQGRPRQGVLSRTLGAFWTQHGGFRWMFYFGCFLWVNCMGWLGIWAFNVVKKRFGKHKKNHDDKKNNETAAAGGEKKKKAQ